MPVDILSMKLCAREFDSEFLHLTDFMLNSGLFVD